MIRRVVGLIMLVASGFAGDSSPLDQIGTAKSDNARETFQSPQSVPVPSLAGPGVERDWIRNPIDAFLATEHAKRGLTPVPAADPATLIRRVCLDLTGLLPSVDQVRRFVADPSDKAYESVVDRLLASPEYGEHSARRWMDAWRYGDWNRTSPEIRESERYGSRWRDQIVASLNRDECGDPFFVATLAADQDSLNAADAAARAIADRRNPLPATVTVKQIWMRHVGAPVVAPALALGPNGWAPSMPALLDWLAFKLVEGGWRLKPIHRLIVTSAAYRMQSSPTGPNDPDLSRDPSNTFLWRMNPKRMEAEVVRDNLLLVSDGLDRRLGGRELDPDQELTITRRSFYFWHANEKHRPFSRLFDSANAMSRCRVDSATPRPAVALDKSSLCLDQARRLARTLAEEIDRLTCACYSGPADLTYDGAFTALAFERVFGRFPTEQERLESETDLATRTKRLASGGDDSEDASEPKSRVAPATEPAQQAREELIHLLFHHNDFIQIR